MVFVNAIRCLAICNTMVALTNFNLFLTLASDPIYHWFCNNWNNYICIPQGVIQQFFGVGAASWNFVLVVMLLAMIYFEKTLEEVNKKENMFHFLVWYVYFRAYVWSKYISNIFCFFSFLSD